MVVLYIWGGGTVTRRNIIERFRRALRYHRGGGERGRGKNQFKLYPPGQHLTPGLLRRADKPVFLFLETLPLKSEKHLTDAVPVHKYVTWVPYFFFLLVCRQTYELSLSLFFCVVGIVKHVIVRPEDLTRPPQQQSGMVTVVFGKKHTDSFPLSIKLVVFT